MGSSTVYSTILNNSEIDSDALLYRVFHDLIVQQTGLGNNLVRPQFQLEPASIPKQDVDWCSFYVTELEDDFTASNIQNNNTQIRVKFQKLQLHCIFYGFNSSKYYNKMMMNLEIEQNRANIRKKGISYMKHEKAIKNYESFNSILVPRFDVDFIFNREIRYEYNISTILTPVVDII